MLKRKINYNEPYDRHDRPITLLDLHALDGTLFHIFRLAVWSPVMTGGFIVDTKFWSMAERLLRHANDVGTYCSLVLGFPTSFYKMILCMVQYAREPGYKSDTTFAALEIELSLYKVALKDEIKGIPPVDAKLGIHSNRVSVVCAYRLCILVATLIPINPLISNQDRTSGNLSNHEARCTVRKAVALLCEARLDPEWHRCYLGCWPVFMLGFCVSGIEDVEVIRQDFETRLLVSSLQEYQRMLNALESFWARFQIPESKRLLSGKKVGLIDV
ncbi:hypothetical protein N7509_004335 [Penicillium cosmopolitanum]|uniref:Uncharacterized protein n=1 Tax=Penicillium cosmopolitanum TaxID=1131564 RepID=A0A9W9W6M6_9EURO|nr:uncharacterized protein N7509_004335 [Penicillium cosmopolitanum]KAJ5404464.1 hypothetical protein N7509_004335 [Penicillium cosmopolitanum]